MFTENLSILKIHKLTQQQYDRELAAGNIDESALYLTPDDCAQVEPITDDEIDAICAVTLELLDEEAF